MRKPRKVWGWSVTWDERLMTAHALYTVGQGLRVMCKTRVGYTVGQGLRVMCGTRVGLSWQVENEPPDYARRICKRCAQIAAKGVTE